MEPFQTDSPSPQPWSVPPARPVHPRLPRRFPVSLPMAIVALVFVLVMVGPFIAVFGVFSGDDGVGGFDSPASHDGPSLVPRERFARALEKVREEAGSEASLTALRVAPERIDAVVVRAGGGQASVQVLPDLDVRTFSAGPGGQRGLSLRRIDPAVPQRLARRAAERLGRKPGDLSYMALVPMSLGGGGMWSVFFSGGGTGRFVVADLDGSNVRVPGQ
ncbi:MAG TPA: hypothetical protein VF712_06305 [Thermoleophilaceae bacterium]